MPRKWNFLLEKDIPIWIRSSPYLESLLENGPLPEKGLQVPKWCLKRDTTINCHNDAVQFLRTARYWLLPDEILLNSNFMNFCFSKERFGLVDLEEEHSLLSGLAAVVSAPSDKKVECAAAHGSHILLQYLCDTMLLPLNAEAAVAAAKAGSVECLKVFQARGFRFTSNMSAAASECGQLACLRYLHQQGTPMSISVLTRAIDEHAARRECLEYVLQHFTVSGTEYDFHSLSSQCNFSARFNELEAVKIVLKHIQLPAVQNAVAGGAATGGHLRILQYCVDQGVKVTEPFTLLNNCIRGAKESYYFTRHERCLSCVEYLYSVGFCGNLETLEAAAEVGSIPIIAFLLKRGCPSSSSVCTILAKHGSTEGLKLARRYDVPWDVSTCANAAASGKLKCLQFVHTNGCPWDTQTCVSAAGAGRLDCLQYAHREICPWDERTCDAAARGGHLSCLKYAHENGCAWKTKSKSSAEKCEAISVSAARAPTVDCLRYVVERGAPVRRVATLNAARAKCLQSLKFLLNYDCKWDSSVCTEAVRVGAFDCLQYLHENGCPWDVQTYTAAAHAGDVYHYYIKHKCEWTEASEWKEQVMKCLKYLQEHACPRPWYCY